LQELYVYGNPQGIFSRHSVRDFLPEPVPEDIVIKIMEAATHSPSGGNSQPWEIFIASGTTIEKIRKAYQERAKVKDNSLSRQSTNHQLKIKPGSLRKRVFFFILSGLLR